MKKLVLLSAVLFGTVVASQAGVHLNIGIGFPFPRSERVIVSRPAPVYVQPAPVCAPAPVYVAPPHYYYVPPRVVYAPPSQYYSYPSQRSYHHGHSNHRDYGRHSSHHR